MGLSSTKSTTGPSKAALPSLNYATNSVKSAASGNEQNLANISGTLSDQFNAYTDELGSNLTAARGYNNDVLSGKFLDQQNPYLQSMIDQTAGDVSDRVNAIFSRSGQTGSSRQIGELGKQMSNAENSLRYQSYSDEMARRDAALGSALGLNSADNANVQTLAGLGSTAATLPLSNAEFLASSLGGLWGNSQTTKSSQSLGSVLGSIAGNAASGWASGGFG